MKLKNVISRLEKKGYWVRNEANDHYIASKQFHRDIKFGGNEVDSFQVGLRYYTSLKKAIYNSKF